MHIVLWIIASVLALVFLGAGLTKILQPKEKLSSTMAWTQDFSQPMIRIIGTLEVLAAVGLILPALLDIAPILVPLAATGLVLLMAGAAITHLRRKEPQIMVANLVLLVLAGIVAWGRFGPYAF
jgi:uncharacterized membrane protein YphA (DoxX/SURF4 family)